jgi:hypothetical protein
MKTETTTEFKVTTNDRVKYFDTYPEALTYYLNQAADFFEEIEQPAEGAEMELQTKDKNNSVRLEIVTE